MRAAARCAIVLGAALLPEISEALVQTLQSGS